MGNVIILGAQWGDEGKGKIVDLFCEKFDVVVRYQGGHNAGHTVQIGDRKFVLKLIPSGILNPSKQAVIGNGLVIDPAALLTEIDSLVAAGIAIDGRLLISDRAHVVFPFHPALDKLSEEKRGSVSIGTTSRGIGPCYEDKAARRGIRIADLMDRSQFRHLLTILYDNKTQMAHAMSGSISFHLSELIEQYEQFAARIRPMVRDTAYFLNSSLRQGKRLLFEGAQGSMLDLDHGTYPYVTSSSATAGGACTGSGVGPNRIAGVIGVSKAYITRVGGGPFPTELLDAIGDRIRKRGNEFGSVTGRPRRCGWFDIPLLKYTSMINGFETMAVTKIDVLDSLESIPVCVGYRQGGKMLETMPATERAVAEMEPVYEELPGWCVDTTGVQEYAGLPAKALDYLRFIEERTGVEAGAVSVGPDRNQTIVKPGSLLERLIS